MSEYVRIPMREQDVETVEAAIYAAHRAKDNELMTKLMALALRMRSQIALHRDPGDAQVGNPSNVFELRSYSKRVEEVSA